MGKDLLKQSPLFASVIDECDLVLASLPEKPSWNIREEISKSPKVSQLYISTFSQPICTALQLGLSELWKSWGVKPLASFGHSSGEIAAAYAVGMLSLRDAMVIAFYRGLYMGRESGSGCDNRKGAMCAVGLGEPDCKDILKLFDGRVALAAVNSPSSCTLSGDDDAVREIVEICKEAGTFCRELRVDMGKKSTLFIDSHKI
jgi:acyl transferase domain-containing protein